MSNNNVDEITPASPMHSVAVRHAPSHDASAAHAFPLPVANRISRPSLQGMQRRASTPSVKKVRVALNKAFKSGKYSPVLPALKLFETGKLEPHHPCFVLLSACLSKMGRGDEAKKYKKKAKELAEQGLLDPIDHMTRLKYFIRNPCSAQKKLIHVEANVHVMKRFVRDELQVGLKVPLLQDRPLKKPSEEDYIRASVFTNLESFKKDEKSNVLPQTAVEQKAEKQALDEAAKACINRMHALVQTFKELPKIQLRKFVAGKMEKWKTRHFLEKCYSAFKDTKDLVLNSSLNELYGAKVFLYGSVTTGLCLSDSDIDVAVKLPKVKNRDIGNELTEKKRNVKVLAHLERCARNKRMKQIYTIPTANVPLLKFIEPSTRVEVDISIANDQAILLSRFFRAHLQVDERIWELCMIVKMWARRRSITGVSQGYINSMGWNIMVIFFLQHISKPRIAGLFSRRSSKSSKDSIHRIEWLNFDDERYRGRDNCKRTDELLSEFFNFFANEFDFRNEAISINMSGRRPRSEVARCGSENAIFIEQPLIEGVNVVGYMCAAEMERTKDELRRAHDICVSSGNGEKLCEIRRVDDWDDSFE